LEKVQPGRLHDVIDVRRREPVAASDTPEHAVEALDEARPSQIAASAGRPDERDELRIEIVARLETR
jgi:hypothetical protein